MSSFSPSIRRLRDLVAIVRVAAVESGREPSAIEITAEAARTDADRATQLELGVGRVVINAPNVDTHAMFDALGSPLDQARATPA